MGAPPAWVYCATRFHIGDLNRPTPRHDPCRPNGGKKQTGNTLAPAFVKQARCDKQGISCSGITWPRATVRQAQWPSILYLVEGPVPSPRSLQPLPPPGPPTIPPLFTGLVVTRKRLLKAPCRCSSPDPMENRDAFVRVSTQKARSPVVLAPRSYNTRCLASTNCVA